MLKTIRLLPAALLFCPALLFSYSTGPDPRLPGAPGDQDVHHLSWRHAAKWWWRKRCVDVIRGRNLCAGSDPDSSVRRPSGH